jgi:hypothetical protein
VIGHLGAETKFWSFHRNWWKYTRPPIILTSAYILACRASTSSRYSTGETPPKKAGRHELCLHLRSTWQRGNLSTRIWTRALQQVQEEVSSWRFCQAQTAQIRWYFTRRGYFNAHQDFIVRLYFCQTPTFCKSANILCICQYFGRRQHFVNPPTFSWQRQHLGVRQYFHEMPIFWKSAYIFMRRQYFGILPTFCKSANGLWICLIFVAAKICVYFQYLFMHLSMRQYFWRNCFNLRFKIDIVLMIIWSIVIIINFVLTL